MNSVNFLIKVVNNNSNTTDTLRRIYDKNSYIECELIYVVDNIVYNALHEK